MTYIYFEVKHAKSSKQVMNLEYWKKKKNDNNVLEKSSET